MFKNIFLKTIYEKRWSLLGWSLGVLVMTIFSVSFFHTLSGGAFDQALKNLPESLKGLVGDTGSYNTINGYLNQQVFIKAMPIMIMIFSIILFTSLLAGDENQGTLQVLLAQPVTRIKVLIQKFLAGSLLVAIVCLGSLAGSIIETLIIREPVNYHGLLAITFNLWLLGMAFGGLAYMFGAVTGRRGLASGLSSIVAFAFYLISSLAAGVKSLATADKFSPLHYYSTSAHNVITQGVRVEDVLVLSGLSLIFTLIGLIVFTKRDIYQQ